MVNFHNLKMLEIFDPYLYIDSDFILSYICTFYTKEFNKCILNKYKYTYYC